MNITRRSVFKLPVFCLLCVLALLLPFGCKASSVGSSSDGGSANDGGGGNDGGSTGNACSCLNPADIVQQEGTCVREGFTCNALSLCEAGYQCSPNNQCECQDTSSCGIACSASCDCPFGLTCDAPSGTCNPPLPCLDDSMCSGGQACQEGDPFGPLAGPMDYVVCVTPSGGTVGDLCDRAWECQSGICYTGVCLQPCVSNTSCPAGQLCAVVEHGTPGCVLQTGCDSCTGPEQLCDHSACKDVNCRTTSDCPVGENCTLQLGRPLFGECRQAHDGICGVDEFAVDALDPDHPICLIYQACWSQAACSAPYSCFSSYDLMMPMIGDPGFCARQL